MSANDSGVTAVACCGSGGGGGCGSGDDGGVRRRRRKEEEEKGVVASCHDTVKYDNSRAKKKGEIGRIYTHLVFPLPMYSPFF